MTIGVQVALLWAMLAGSIIAILYTLNKSSSRVDRDIDDLEQRVSKLEEQRKDDW